MSNEALAYCLLTVLLLAARTRPEPAPIIDGEEVILKSDE